MRERLTAGKAPRDICEEMCDHCLAPDTGGCGKGCGACGRVGLPACMGSQLARAALGSWQPAGAAAGASQGSQPAKLCSVHCKPADPGVSFLSLPVPMQTT